MASSKLGGDEGDRTPDLMNAIHALSQLSYVPGESRTDIIQFPFSVVQWLTCL